MQSFTRCCLLLGCLALAACGREPQLKLTFDEPVSASGSIDWDYQNSLQKVFTELGYKPSHLRYTEVEGDTHAMLVSLQPDPLSQAQRDAVMARFDPVLAARGRWPAHIELQGEGAELPVTVSAALSLPGRPELVAWQYDPYSASTVSREVFCHFVVKLDSALPALEFQAADTEDERPGGAGSVRFADADQRWPVVARFSDPDLQRGLEQQEFHVRLDNEPHMLLPIKELVFDFGSMGRQAFIGTQTILGDENHGHCADRAEAFGLPFTLFMGKSVDRLTNVAFLDAQQ